MRLVLDRLDREDVQLHQPRCANASAYGLREYMDTLFPLIAMHHHDLACAKENFEITTFPNSGIQARSMRRCYMHE